MRITQLGLVNLPAVIGLWLVAVASAVAYPVGLTDATGTTLHLQQAPRRIVSLSLYTDEMLKDLVADSRVLAVSDFAVDPGVSNVADWAKRIGRHLPFSVEAVVALQPDLVLVAQWSDAAKIRQLRLAGLTVAAVALPQSFSRLTDTIDWLSRLCGVVEQGRRLIGRINQRLADLDRRVAAKLGSRRFSLVEFNDWGSGSGAGTSWDAIAVRAGFLNPLAKLAADNWGQVPVGKEFIVKLNPDCLMIVDWVYGRPDGPDRLSRSLRQDPLLAALPAVRAGRVLRVPGKYRLVTSQYMVDAAEYMAVQAERLLAGAKF